MDATDLYKLGVQLIEKLGWKLFVPYLGGTDKLENAKERLIKLTDSLLSSYSYIPLGEHQTINKKWERSVKQVLYRVETLVREIEAFLEEGQHPKSVLESFRSSTSTEMELILEEITLFPDALPMTPTSEIVVGQEFMDQKERLLKLLLDSRSSPVIPVLGKPGSGKSTLARLALDDTRVRNHFDSKAFLNLTFSSFQDIVCEAIQCLGRGILRSPDWPGQLDYLMEQLKKAADGSKCLLILDDLDAEKLKSLLSVNKNDPIYSAFLEVATTGTKIVITSSLELVGSPAISLPSLNEAESWELFKKIVYPDQGRRQPMPSDGGLAICQQCKNIPSVINTVASIMYPKHTLEEWRHFLDDVMTSVPNPTTIISSIFVLTELHCHHQIQKSWRNCFAWCSLIPRDYEFGKDYIFLLWRAQEVFMGDDGMTQNDLDRCFDEFIMRGYFLKGHSTGSVARYRISYLVSELMKYVAGEDFCLVEEATAKPNHKIIRHVSFIVDPSWEPPSWLPEAKQLQSILLWPRSSNESISASKMDFTSVCMTDQRTLDTQTVHCESFPVFLFECEMLEYLRLGATSMIYAPEYIPLLKKVLDTAPQKSIKEKLALYGEGEQLVLLVKYNRFKKMSARSEKCNELDSLKQKDELLWSLKIKELPSSNPHQTVQGIKDHQWKGETIPAFVIDEFSAIFPMLVSIDIVYCSGCQHLPGFDMLPLLNSLKLRALYFLVEIAISCESIEASSSNTFYPSLKCLVLCDLPQFKGWSNTEEDDDQLILEQLSFPLLTEFRVKGCPMLDSMPSVPMLESLEAINVNAKILNHLLCCPLKDPSRTDDNQELTEISEQHHYLINTLEIDSCKEFDWGDKPNAVEKVAWHTFRSLRSLKLTNAPDLVSLPGGLECITTLEQLSLHWLANLMVLPEWIGQFTQLRQLTLHYCMKLRMLPNFGGSFSALEQLEILHCPRLSQFPESFPNLKRLRVQEFCRLEQILRVSQNLEELEIENCEELDLEMQTVEGDSPMAVWEGLKSLYSLKLTKMDLLPKGLDFEKLPKLSQLVIQNCPELNTLPESLCSLSNLEDLRIRCCPGLIKIPQSFSNLRCLKYLEIRYSPHVEKRCEKPNGADWDLIQHIPDFISGHEL